VFNPEAVNEIVSALHETSLLAEILAGGHIEKHNYNFSLAHSPLPLNIYWIPN